jgi:hypothetical protein
MFDAIARQAMPAYQEAKEFTANWEMKLMDSNKRQVLLIDMQRVRRFSQRTASSQ